MDGPLCRGPHHIVECFVGQLCVAILTAIRVPPTELGNNNSTQAPRNDFRSLWNKSCKCRICKNHLSRIVLAFFVRHQNNSQTHKNHYSKILRDRPCSKRQKHILTLWYFNAMDGSTALGATLLICLAFVDHHHLLAITQVGPNAI